MLAFDNGHTVSSPESPNAIIQAMDEEALTHWLEALADAGLIREWQWDLEGEGELALPAL
jgi:hypothetical protein